jgi:hypothetical protein
MAQSVVSFAPRIPVRGVLSEEQHSRDVLWRASVGEFGQGQSDNGTRRHLTCGLAGFQEGIRVRIQVGHRAS